MALVDQEPIKATAILAGAFMDMLGREMPIIQPRIRRVLYWHDQKQLLDFTTKDDVAAYVAASALDETAPRILRIACDSISASVIAVAMTEVAAKRFRTLWAGGLLSLSVMIRIAKLVAPGGDQPFPP